MVICLFLHWIFLGFLKPSWDSGALYFVQGLVAQVALMVIRIYSCVSGYATRGLVFAYRHSLLYDPTALVGQLVQIKENRSLAGSRVCVCLFSLFIAIFLCVCVCARRISSRQLVFIREKTRERRVHASRERAVLMLVHVGGALRQDKT